MQISGDGYAGETRKVNDSAHGYNYEVSVWTLDARGKRTGGSASGLYTYVRAMDELRARCDALRHQRPMFEVMAGAICER